MIRTNSLACSTVSSTSGLSPVFDLARTLIPAVPAVLYAYSAVRVFPNVFVVGILRFLERREGAVGYPTFPPYWRSWNSPVS